MNIKELYTYLKEKYGELDWWPCDGERYGNEEIAVGAILTQNTSWSNVERALNNIKRVTPITLKNIISLGEEKIKEIIRPAGFYNQKTKTLFSFSYYIVNNYISLKSFFESSEDVIELRKNLLSLKGIGKETADSILLYSGFKNIFVVDKYTYRLFKYYNIIPLNAKFDYENIRNRVEKEIKKVYDKQQFHALIVEEVKNNRKKYQSIM